MIHEIWKPVLGYEGLYDVSNLGRVRNMARRSGTKPLRILKQEPMHRGYLCVPLSGKGIRKLCRVHRLVMAAFVGPSPDGKHVNHINGDKRDNRLENLEYLTASENTAHAMKIGTMRAWGENNPFAKLSDSDATRIRERRKEGQTFIAIGKEFGVHATTVGRICRGELRNDLLALAEALEVK